MRIDGAAPRLVVRAVEPGVRPVRLRLPFRFGAHTLTACPQAFVRVELDVAGCGRSIGWAAELMVPKWFDKRPQRSPVQNVADLALALRDAAAAYLGDAPASAFGLFERHHVALQVQGADAALTTLSAGYGQALLDRAVLDALCRALGVNVFDALRRNAVGLGDSPLLPDLAGLDWPAWLAARQALRRIEARHTVGLLDELDSLRRGDDGLPLSLRAAIQSYGHRCFKIKLGGEPVADLRRLREVLGLLAAEAPGYRYSLDGNEQYAERAGLFALIDGLQALPAPMYLEQPLPREQSLGAPLAWPAGAPPLLLDEADGTLDAFVQARDAGWAGVSSKSCKGLYKAIVNRARCDRWNAADGATRHFMSAEDLTCQAGLSLQQDLALAALLGLDHAERNGHHYGDGLGAAPAGERQAFAAAHADLYATSGDAVPRLRIARGLIAIDSLFEPGFAHGPDPDRAALLPLDRCTALL